LVLHEVVKRITFICPIVIRKHEIIYRVAVFLDGEDIKYQKKALGFAYMLSTYTKPNFPQIIENIIKKP